MGYKKESTIHGRSKEIDTTLTLDGADDKSGRTGPGRGTDEDRWGIERVIGERLLERNLSAGVLGEELSLTIEPLCSPSIAWRLDGRSLLEGEDASRSVYTHVNFLCRR